MQKAYKSLEHDYNELTDSYNVLFDMYHKELEKQKIAELEKLRKELNFYKPELKIINGKMEFESVTYRAGDVFLGRFKIEQISKNTIRFSRNGQAYNLRF